jgi:hypothetical protein
MVYSLKNNKMVDIRGAEILVKNEAISLEDSDHYTKYHINNVERHPKEFDGKARF